MASLAELVNSTPDILRDETNTLTWICVEAILTSMQDTTTNQTVRTHRYLVKSTFGLGRDFAVYDEKAKTKLYFVDGKMGIRTKADIEDISGTTVLRAHGRLFDIPKHMKFITPDGHVVASIKAKFFSPMKSRMTITLADGTEWKLEGNLIEKNYRVMVNGSPIMQVDQKWMTVRDKYYVEVSDSVNLPLIFGIVWAIDIWRERNNN